MPDKALDDDLVMNLVELALARPPAEREAFLREACAGDPDLLTVTLDYVQWEQRMQGFLLDPLYPAPSPEPALEPGQVLDGRFRILRHVARGGMGVVYEALDEKLDRRIALKCPRAGCHKRLQPEVRNAQEITHPNVCKIFEIHTSSAGGEEMDFLTMEFLAGETLNERLRRGPLPQPEALAIARQLAAGLAEAHRNRVVHGDLKSSNVILTTAPDGGLRAVITDFGLARRRETSEQTLQSGWGGGTPDYMAPELWRGAAASPASDVYALGIIFYEMISGKRPFGPATPLKERFTLKPPAVHPKWDRALARCLDPDPALRFPHGAAVAQALAPRSRRMVLAAAAAVVLAAISGVVSYERGSVAPRETIRLAVLPFDSDPQTASLGDGLLDDAADRLAHLKSGAARLTLISLSDAIRNKVSRPEQAGKKLGATYTLSGTLLRQNDRILVHAYLTDARSQVRLADWSAGYPAKDLRNLPVALAGMVTSTLRLPPLAAAATVKPAAYVDFATGVSLARRDTGVDAALPFLERAVAEDPDSPLTHARLAEAQMLKYRVTKDSSWLDRAKASLHAAEQINPDVAVVRMISALISQYAGSYEAAQSDLQRALEISPTDGDLWRRLGKLYKDNSRFEHARFALLKAIAVQPDYFKNYQDLCSLYSDQANYDAAIAECRKMVQLAPELWESHFALALPYLNAGRYAEAETELGASLHLEEAPPALLALAVALMFQDRNAEAIPYLQRAIDIGPPSHLMYLNLGIALRRLGRAQEADVAFRRGLGLAEAGLARNPRDAIVRAQLAYLAARLRDRNRAESEASQALQLAPGSVETEWPVVLTYEALGELDRALSVARNLPPDALRRANVFPDLQDLRADSRFQELLLSHHVQ